ncbi:MAG TPA: sulfite exporter TauE/SafE family protein [Nitrospirae bacterium]|nr:sulfite exporter TauE/SafE family protein [Nitrospirota bacterium]
MSPEYWLAFMTGLLGGFGHCIGMCGPIVASYSFRGAGGSYYIPHLLYNAGRITTYGIIGALMGMGGAAISAVPGLPFARFFVMMTVGAIMVLLGLPVVFGRNTATGIDEGGGVFIKAGKTVLETDSAFKYYPLGLALGFLPCGMSYSIFFGAAALGSATFGSGALEGGAFAMSFALGTVPALFLFGMVASYIGSHLRGLLFRSGGIVVVFMGLRFLLKGLSIYARM